MKLNFNGYLLIGIEKKKHVSSVAAYEVPADVFSSNKATSGAANGINS